MIQAELQYTKGNVGVNLCEAFEILQQERNEGFEWGVEMKSENDDEE